MALTARALAMSEDSNNSSSALAAALICWRKNWCRPCTTLCWIDLSAKICLLERIKLVQNLLRGLCFEWLPTPLAFTSAV